MVTEFRNEPLTDFTRPEHRAAFAEALARVEAQPPEDIPLVIGGERIRTSAVIVSTNPTRPAQVLGRVASGDAALVDRAIYAAHGAFAGWSRTAPADRAELLFRGADLMRRRKHELSALLVLEAGKSWPEADADTAEAIDFLEYYGREMLRYAAGMSVVPDPGGERNRVEYVPLGAGVVISPWNFPLALLAGMSSAAVAAGNTVVMKPASVTPVIAWRYQQLMEEAGAPPGVFNYLPGPGGAVGDALVDHPLTRFVSFTGSRDVGVRIYERAAKVQPGQVWLKRVVAEMGGKDAIVVDETADLEAAADGVVAAAFGYGGQKCSACSRAIVVGSVHDALVEKLKVRAARLAVGDPRDPATFMGPVIDAKAREKILAYIEAGLHEGKLECGGAAPVREGYFVPPTIFSGIGPRDRLAQEEIFGPVLSVIRAKDFEEALAIANDTDYGLTGALYSQDEARLDRAAREFHVGNLYLNRKCTGAMVGVHPFGGFKMSGTDSKAGGRDYLGLFLQGKSICRRG